MELWALAMPWEKGLFGKRKGLLYGYNTAPKATDSTVQQTRSMFWLCSTVAASRKRRLVHRALSFGNSSAAPARATAGVVDFLPLWGGRDPHVALLLSQRTLFCAVDFAVTGGHESFRRHALPTKLSQSESGFVVVTGAGPKARFACLSADFGKPLLWPWEVLHFYIIDLAKSRTGCDTQPAVASDWPRALLTLRGECPFARKASVASAAGYSLLIVANDYNQGGSGVIPMTMDRQTTDVSLTSVMISFEDGKQIIERVLSIEADFPVSISVARNTSAAWAPAASKLRDLLVAQDGQELGPCGSDHDQTDGTGGLRCYVVGQQVRERVNSLAPAAYAPVYQLLAPHVEQLLAVFGGPLPTVKGSTYSPPLALVTAPPPRGRGTTRVVVVVFFGRRETFEILHWHLDRNRRASGGLIDEVVLVPNTSDEDDIKYMHGLLASYAWYRPSSCCTYGSWEKEMQLYGRYYAELSDRDAIYVKLDDDVVYIHDGAIEALVDTKLKFRNALVSANVINHPRLFHIHYRNGLIRRVRDGPWAAVQARKESTISPQPTFPTSSRPCSFIDDPWGHAEHGDCGCAAAIHESFLADLEVGRTHAWAKLDPSMGRELHESSDILMLHSDNDHTCWSVNAFALGNRNFRGINTALLALRLLIDDEEFLSEAYPRASATAATPSGIKCIAAGSALLVQYSYHPQAAGWCEAGNGCANVSSSSGNSSSGTEWQGGLVRDTGDSILSRYRSYAEIAWRRWKEKGRPRTA